MSVFVKYYNLRHKFYFSQRSFIIFLQRKNIVTMILINKPYILTISITLIPE